VESVRGEATDGAQETTIKMIRHIVKL